MTRLEGVVSGPQDLPKVRVATVHNTAATRYLDRQHCHFTGFPTLSAAIDALARGDVDALVYDVPLLSYLLSQRSTPDIKVLDVLFARQTYAIALPSGSPLRKPVNEAVLSILGTPEWQDALQQWMPEK